MSNTTAAADGAAMPATDPTESATRAEPTLDESFMSVDRFREVHFEWLCAKTAMSEPSDDVLLTEDEFGRRHRREWLAQRALVATPAPQLWALLAKWALLEDLMISEQDGGQDSWSLAIITAAALKADILAIGLNGRHAAHRGRHPDDRDRAAVPKATLRQAVGSRE